MSDENMNQENEVEVADGSPEFDGADLEAGASLDLDRLSQLECELEEVRQHVLYAQAETHNVRRRLEQEKVNAATYAATGFARDILSVKDNLERALSAIPDELRQDDRLKGLVTGIEATARELDSVFQRHGVSRVAALGETLDPNRHQAMLEVPSDQPAGTIVQELQPGYVLKDRLLRPALVGVAKQPD